MELTCLDFLLTYKCISECEHCLYYASPRAEVVMILQDAQTYLEEAEGIKTVVIHGGEPFLYFDLLTGIVKAAKKFETKRIWVMTNCYWAKTQKVAEKKLTALKNAGYTHMLFSADAFHQTFIPLERVKIALDVARRMEFPNIIVNSLFLGG